MSLVIFAIAFFASVIGAICGIGGGIAGRCLNKKLTAQSGGKAFCGLDTRHRAHQLL